MIKLSEFLIIKDLHIVNHAFLNEIFTVNRKKAKWHRSDSTISNKKNK